MSKMQFKRRTGLSGVKVGMSEIYNDNGACIPVTIIKVLENEVLNYKTEDKDGYNAIVLAFSLNKIKNVSKSVKGTYTKLDKTVRSNIKEFRVTANVLENKISTYKADFFKKGQFLDIVGTSKGKGFAGVMKRHGFSGLRASHGVSLSHRSGGSTGHCTEPSRVFKNKKMPGHMGAERKTVQNIKLIDVNLEDNLLIVRGAVPGPKKGLVFVSDSIKKYIPEELC